MDAFFVIDGDSAPRASVRSSILRRLAFLVGFVWACGAPPPRYPIRDAAPFVAAFRARDARLHAMSARGSADSFGTRGRVRGAVTLFVELGDAAATPPIPPRMRVDASAFGAVVSSMASDGTHFTLLQGLDLYTGPARACVAGQLIGIPLEPAQVAEVLVGGAPLIDGPLQPPRWEDNHYVIDLRDAHGHTERIEMELPSEQRALPPERQTPRLHRVVLRDGSGVRADVTYDGYRDVAGIAFPDRVRIEMPREHADSQIRFDHIEPNFTLPTDPENPNAPRANPYVIVRPQGARVVPIECE